jgi:trigger factor
MMPEFEAAVTGMKAGSRKSFDMTFPDDYHGKEVAGKQVTFSVTLHKVDAEAAGGGCRVCRVCRY